MSNKKQTAVEIYSTKMAEILGDLCNQMTQEQTLKSHYLLKECKELEKQQIIDARQDGIQVGLSVGYTERIPTNQYYYKETYEQ